MRNVAWLSATVACWLTLPGCETTRSPNVAAAVSTPFDAFEWAVSESTGVNQGIREYYFPDGDGLEQVEENASRP